jgi:hypothetical protein
MWSSEKEANSSNSSSGGTQYYGLQTVLSAGVDIIKTV